MPRIRCRSKAREPNRFSLSRLEDLPEPLDHSQATTQEIGRDPGTEIAAARRLERLAQSDDLEISQVPAIGHIRVASGEQELILGAHHDDLDEAPVETLVRLGVGEGGCPGTEPQVGAVRLAAREARRPLTL